MKVRILIPLTGLRNDKKYPPVGGVMELEPGDTGEELLRNGYAELVPEPKPVPKPVVETAEVAPPQNTAARTAKPAPRTRKPK
jgi:hypothetical protein